MPPLPNYPEFFTRRERALLGARFGFKTGKYL